MGRDRTSALQKSVRGNPGKRKVLSLPLDLPEVKRPTDLTSDERKYWDRLAPHLKRDGRLNHLTVPAFLHLIRKCVSRDDVDLFLRENKAYWEETKFVDSSGQEHTSLKESAPSKLSRDLSQTCSRLEKLWGITGMQMQGVTSGEVDPLEEFMKGRK